MPAAANAAYSDASLPVSNADVDSSISTSRGLDSSTLKAMETASQAAYGMRSCGDA
jgi:hypothetical protein